MIRLLTVILLALCMMRANTVQLNSPPQMMETDNGDTSMTTTEKISGSGILSAVKSAKTFAEHMFETMVEATNTDKINNNTEAFGTTITNDNNVTETVSPMTDILSDVKTTAIATQITTSGVTVTDGSAATAVDGFIVTGIEGSTAAAIDGFTATTANDGFTATANDGFTATANDGFTANDVSTAAAVDTSIGTVIDTSGAATRVVDVATVIVADASTTTDDRATTENIALDAVTSAAVVDTIKPKNEIDYDKMVGLWDETQVVIGNCSLDRVGFIQSPSPLFSKVILKNVSIDRLTYGILHAEYPDSISSLYWTNSGIRTINGLPFRNLIELNLNDNRLDNTEIIPAEYVSKLEILDLSNNRLRYLIGFLYASKVKVLKMRNNLFTHLSRAYDLKSFNELTYLDVSGNNINRLCYFDLRYISSLKEFTIENSNVTFIHPHAFETNVHLERISLAHNPITVLHNELFERNKELEEINLSWTRIVHLNPELFAPVEILKHVDLVGLPVREIPKKLLKQNMFLEELIIANTSITGFSPAVIRSLYNLRVLRIANNSRLYEFADDTFANNKKLSLLDLSGNSLERIPKSVTSLPLLDLLDLSVNPKLCNCDSKWLLRWYKNVTAPGGIMAKRIVQDDIEDVGYGVQVRTNDESKGLQIFFNNPCGVENNNNNTNINNNNDVTDDVNGGYDIVMMLSDLECAAGSLITPEETMEIGIDWLAAADDDNEKDKIKKGTIDKINLEDYIAIDENDDITTEIKAMGAVFAYVHISLLTMPFAVMYTWRKNNHQSIKVLFGTFRKSGNGAKKGFAESGKADGEFERYLIALDDQLAIPDENGVLIKGKIDLNESGI